jgi:hypothetical protein
MANPRGTRRNQQPTDKDEPDDPSIALLCTKEYTAVNRLPERNHLTNDNWYDWKERMSRVFTNCDTVDTLLTHTPSVDLPGYGLRESMGFQGVPTV